MKKTNLRVVAFVAAMAVIVAFLCAGCNDGGVKSGGGDAVAFLNRFSEESVHKGDDGSGSGTFTDARDGQTYRKVQIGKQTWMAENLNYIPSSGNSWCYENLRDNCDTYGRLYDWKTAMGLDASYNNKVWGGRDVASKKICPAGWHLPSDKEWEELMLYFCSDLRTCSLQELMADYGWIGVSGALDVYGFSALPGGSYAKGKHYDDYDDPSDYYDTFQGVGYYGEWLSTQDTKNQRYDIEYSGLEVDVFYLRGEDGSSSILPSEKTWGHSVRCVHGN